MGVCIENILDLEIALLTQKEGIELILSDLSCTEVSIQMFGVCFGSDILYFPFTLDELDHFIVKLLER
jgi:hypothetical protein